jgi:hypothetical protein
MASRPRQAWLAIPTALFCATLLARVSAERLPSPPAAVPSASAAVQTSGSGKDIPTVEEVQTRCGTVCHKYPPPDILPRSAWRDELVRMMLISEGVPEPAGASSYIPLPPDWLRLLRFYEANAPEKLPPPEPWPAPSPNAPVPFNKTTITSAAATGAIAIANVRFFDLDADKAPDIVATEMRTGPVLAGLAKEGWALKPIARLSHPAHAEQVDLDRDGLQDLVVADLGSFQPADHSDGAVYWLRRAKNGSYTTVALAKNLARMADVRAADFDGDGDLDLVLGIFGWRTTGNVTLLENRTRDWQKPEFVAHLVDSRNGAIHVPVTDVNKDGRPDFIALLAQQFESVVAYVNTGKLTFKQETIYAAPHPNWGSSGIDLVDLDKDGDQDVLMTHGDTFDDFVLKPYHGIIWLENTGSYPYVAHQLALLPGAQRAQAADLDGDGDLDIVASAMISGGDVTPSLASLVWLEQISPGKFERRTLESGTPFHATLDVADVDGDGDTDLAVGWFALGRPLGAWVDLWVNQRRAK